VSAPACQHEDFAARVEVHRLTDDAGNVRNFVAEVTVRCVACDLPFHFVGPEAGYSFARPTVNIGATTLHAPIAPGESTVIPSRIRYEVA
jgi:hypothetical protein